MARKPVVDMSAWPSITLEGNLIAPAMVAQIAAPKDDQDTQASYRIRRGLTIREEISTAFRVGQSHFDAFAKIAQPSPDATRRFIRGLLQEAFGFDDLAPAPAPLSWLAGDRVPIVVVPPSERLDRRSATLSTDRTRSPAIALQDHLNDHQDTLWGLVTNGMLIRLLRDNASLTRPAYIEADLAQIFTNEDAASFAILWLLIHRSRFGVTGAPAPDCALERWRDAGGRQGEVARDRLAAQVQTALKLLGSGFLDANPGLAARLKSGEVNLTDWFNELLRLVYRLIFLMVAEDRNLLHPDAADTDARQLYAQGYSLGYLRAQCTRAASWDKHHDRYEGIKIVFRALARGEPALALPALGGLFSDDKLPHLESARLRNRALMEALYRLAWLADKTGMVPVNWRAMETEELGSVYESLLELQPQLGDDGRTLVFASESAEQKGNQRKTTGSYYTPDSLVQALLDTALDPVLDRTEAQANDPARALLQLTVIDPACGSGHFLLAAARRIAARVARHRADGTPSLADYRHALRDVARVCLHGVDRNPMAVELTKVALWIETVDPGLPLGFFDAAIRCGDALLGVFDLQVLQDGIPDAAYKPLTGDDKDTAKHFAKRNRSEREGQGTLDFARGGGTAPLARQLADLGGQLRGLPETTLAEIAAKARAWADLRSDRRWFDYKIACDAYVAAFLAPKTGGLPASPGAALIPTTDHVRQAMAGRVLYGPLSARIDTLAHAARALHWPLEFPDVMQRGGFDVVLGNPPWERIKLQEQEFFAALSPEIANAANKAARDRLIKALEKAAPGTGERALFDSFTEAKHEAEATSEFVRLPGEDGGRFALTGTGDVNTYGLFAELFLGLAKNYAGVIVPTGIATDSTYAPFFSHIVKERRLIQLIDFENRDGIFSSVHRSYKFCLLTLGRNVSEAKFAFFLSNPSQLVEPERNFTLSPAQITDLNPNTGTAPVLRTRADAEITAKIYATSPILVPSNGDAKGDEWQLRLRTLFHKSKAAQDGHIKPAIDANLSDSDWEPAYEGDYGHQFDHRFGTFEHGAVRDVTPAEHVDTEFEPVFEWVGSRQEFERKMEYWGVPLKRSAILAFRRVARSTDERTSLAAMIPFRSVTNSWILVLDPDPHAQAALCGAMNSLVLDYCLRNSLSQPSIPQNVYEQLPVPRPSKLMNETCLAFVTPKVLELTYTSHSLTPFARDLGHDGPPFAWDEDRRAHLRADLDAFYARAYGLTRDELRYILDPADARGPDYPSETFRVLKEKEIRLHGEYRTRRLVLAAWDRMAADGTFAALGLP